MAGWTDGRMASAFFGSLMLLTGAVLFIVGIQERHDSRVLGARGVVVDAPVVDTAAAPQVRQVGGAFSAHYGQKVTFHFEDEHGRPRTTTMKVSTKAYTVGETVRLLYDAGAPKDVYLFDSCNGWFSCDRGWVASIAVGSLMWLVTAAIVLTELPRPTAMPPRRRTLARSI